MTCKDKKELPEYVEKNWKFLNPDLKIKIYDEKKQPIHREVTKIDSEYQTISKGE